jgi:hypothetical protein
MIEVADLLVGVIVACLFLIVLVWVAERCSRPRGLF